MHKCKKELSICPVPEDLGMAFFGLCRFVFKVYLFILRARKSTNGGGAEREGRARIPSGVRTGGVEPDAGLELMHCETVT